MEAIRTSLPAFLLILTSIYGWGQESDDDHIQYIRKRFKEVNDLCNTIKPVVFRSDTLAPEGPVTFREWKHEEQVIRFQVTEHRDVDKFVSDYYFGEGGLIFAFTQDFLRDELSERYVRENRYYFKDDETLIRWLDEEKREVNPAGTRFTTRGHHIWEHMYSWSDVFFWVYGSWQASDRKSRNVGNMDQDIYTIQPAGFYGIVCGQAIGNFSQKLVKGKLETGEGSFEVYYITAPGGQQLGYVLPHSHEEAKVGTIVITSSLAHTPEDIKVGSTFWDLQSRIPGIEVHGSELEGRTTASVGNREFLLDAYHTSYQIDASLIAPETKIKQILVVPMR